MPEKAIDSTEIIPFDPKNAPDHWHDGPALPEPLYGGCLGKAINDLLNNTKNSRTFVYTSL